MMLNVCPIIREVSKQVNNFIWMLLNYFNLHLIFVGGCSFDFYNKLKLFEICGQRVHDGPEDFVEGGSEDLVRR